MHNNGKVNITTSAFIKKYDLADLSATDDHDYCDAPHVPKLSEYKSAAIAYIARYVAAAVQKQTTTCQRCKRALGPTTGKCSGFLKYKDNGGLAKHSQSVILLCQQAEKCFERMLKTTSVNLQYTPRWRDFKCPVECGFRSSSRECVQRPERSQVRFYRRRKSCMHFDKSSGLNVLQNSFVLFGKRKNR